MILVHIPHEESAIVSKSKYNPSPQSLFSRKKYAKLLKKVAIANATINRIKPFHGILRRIENKIMVNTSETPAIGSSINTYTE
jgi:hypothetical protein